MKKISKESYINRDVLTKYLQENFLNSKEDELLSELEKHVEKFIAEKKLLAKNKKRIELNDLGKEHIPALQNLSEDEINSLPSWVICDLENAQLVGASKKVIQTSDGRKYHLNNRLNSLSGNEWTFFLNSVINTRYSTNGSESYAHHIRKIHPSPKPPQLTKQIIEFFTKENDIVLDYFMGVGGTLLGASLCDRRAIGIDLNQEYINAYKEANAFLNLKEQITFNGDSLDILNSEDLKQAFGGEKASLILIDPPYGNMMTREKTGETLKKKKDTSPTPFTTLNSDLGNMDLDQFIVKFKKSIEQCLNLLKDKGHLVVFVKDLQPKGKDLNLLHSDLILSLNEIPEIHYIGTKIWADQNVNLYPYGYPFSYVANQIHQYILIFRKNAL
jgi:DNA modification methylase